jgi:hypothetical protein
MPHSDEENPIEIPLSFTFNEEQLQILQQHLSGIKAAETKKERHKLVKTARKEVMALPASKALPAEIRDKLTVAINSWFAVRVKSSKNKIKFGKAWTGRLVMYHEKKEEVNEVKGQLFDEAKAAGEDARTAFNFFQKAITEVWNELSATEWNKDGVSREQKQE